MDNLNTIQYNTIESVYIEIEIEIEIYTHTYIYVYIRKHIQKHIDNKAYIEIYKSTHTKKTYF